jgi:PIN domain nuclease of toxin-antitoxin system
MGQFGVILLDTHVAIWLLSDFEKLSQVAKHEIVKARSKGGGLAISCVTLLEIVRLAEKGRVEFGMGLRSFLRSLETTFKVISITSRACALIPELPANYPKDPADRIIGATALAEGLTLITADRNILASKAVRTAW